ncbi:hypothetical protein SESBI_08632 [Sesbania bispinosa]|nr:hypothetical protein SESBI_08632 [Sesbania bispinosa]
MKNELSLTKEERTTVEVVRAHCVPPSHCCHRRAPLRLHFPFCHYPSSNRESPLATLLPIQNERVVASILEAIDDCYVTAKLGQLPLVLRRVAAVVASHSSTSAAVLLQCPSPHLLVCLSN